MTFRDSSYIVSKGAKGGHRVWFLQLAINSYKYWIWIISWKFSFLEKIRQNGNVGLVLSIENEVICDFVKLATVWTVHSLELSDMGSLPQLFSYKAQNEEIFYVGVASQVGSSNTVTNQPENLGCFWDYWTQTKWIDTKLNNPNLWRQG